MKYKVFFFFIAMFSQIGLIMSWEERFKAICNGCFLDSSSRSARRAQYVFQLEIMVNVNRSCGNYSYKTLTEQQKRSP